MPEGHTIRRDATRLLKSLAGPVRASSPQGRFGAGATLIHGTHLVSSDAHGKHLFLGFSADPENTSAHRWLHVHLGLYGKWTLTKFDGPAPEPVGAVRLRLLGDGVLADLRGPTTCEMIVPEQKQQIHARLGADPLRMDAQPDLAGQRILRSRVAIGALLMQQEVLAGVGNVYRAEVLFRAGIDPYLPGRKLRESQWEELWRDLQALLKAGVRAGRMVTTRPADRPSGRVNRDSAYYVYRRAGLGCRLCGTAIVAEPFVARTLYRCPSCQ